MRPKWHHLVVIMALNGCAASPSQEPSTPERPASPAPPAALPAKLPWPAGIGCRELATALAAVPVAERTRLDPSDAPLGVTMRMADGAPPGDVTGDLPLPPDDELRRCALIVESDGSAPAAPRRMLGHERVRSVYRTRAAGRANPEHRRLQAELRDMESDEGPQILATGDPGLDLIGLVAGSVLDGISTALDGQRTRALRERMAATPARLEEVAWEPYSFEVTTVEATRSGKVRALLVDRATGDVFPLEETVVETRRFRVAQGRRARDRGLLEGGGDGLVDLEDVAVWEQAGIRPGVAALLAVLPEQPAASTSPPGAVEAALFGSGSVVAEVGSDGVRRFRLGGFTTEAGLGADP